MNCGIAQALEALGDWWTLLIVRDAFFGARRFGDFQHSLGIAKNILSDRLQRLVEHEIFAKVDVGDSGQRFEYRLTEKGEALLPLLTALREWSDEWIFGRGHEPVIVRDRRTRRRLPKRKSSPATTTAAPARCAAANSSGSCWATSSVKSSTVVSATPSSASSSSRRSTVAIDSTRLPLTTPRGCGWKVSTRTGSPVSSAASITRR